MIVSASQALAKKLPTQVQEALHSRYGYHLPVILRTNAELRSLAERNPFLQAAVVPKQHYLMCLADEPSTQQCAALESARFAPDAFEVRGKDVYLYFPNGAARSKLTNAYFDKKLSTTSTVRNWNTLIKLVELSGEPKGSVP